MAELIRFRSEIEEAIKKRELPLELVDYIINSDKYYTFNSVSFGAHSTITFKEGKTLLTFTAIWNLNIREGIVVSGYNQNLWRFVVDIRKVGDQYFLLTQEAWGRGIVNLDNVIIEPFAYEDENQSPRTKLLNKILAKINEKGDGLFDDYKGQMLDLDLQQLRILGNDKI